MLGVSYKNVALPLMFKMLDKRGNSHTKERIELIRKYIYWFGRDTINYLLVDREFVGADLLEFLNDYRIGYHIRIRNNFMVYSYQKQKEIPAFWLFNNLKINEFRHYSKIVKLHGQDCYLSGSKTINREGKMEFYFVIKKCLESPQASYDKYLHCEALCRRESFQSIPKFRAFPRLTLC